MKTVSEEITKCRKKHKIRVLSKKSKGNLVLKKKLKKILQSDNFDDLNEPDFSTEENVVELDSESISSSCDSSHHLRNNKNKCDVLSKNKKDSVPITSTLSKPKHKKIKSKETVVEENAMIKTISNIILSEKETLKERAMDLTKLCKLDFFNENSKAFSKQKSKNKNKGNLEKIKSTKDVKESSKLNNESKNPVINDSKMQNIFETEASVLENYVFDPNLSLAEKIKSKIREKKCIKQDRENKTNLKTVLPNILAGSKYFSKRKKKVEQNVTYKHSVLEIFSDFEMKDAPEQTIKSQDMDIEKIDDIQNLEISQTHAIHKDSNVFVDSESNITYNESSDENNESNVKNYRFVQWENKTFLVMKPDTQLFFCGKLSAYVLRGRVEVLGHKLTNLPQIIYSPPTSSLMCFESFSQEEPMDVVDILISEKIDKDEAIVVLEAVDNSMTEFISKYFMKFSIFSKEKNTFNNVDKSAFSTLKCVFFTGLRKGVLVKNFYWDNISEFIVQKYEKDSLIRNVTMLCGGKNTGKSTMLRYLVNKVTPNTPVLVIDLDPGQPEFTICGLLSATKIQESLLGPGFTHLKETHRSLSLGLISVSDNEQRYLNCVKDLIKYCEECEEFLKIPWIINTMGFTESVGLKLLISIMNLVQPTIVVELNSNIKRNNYEIQLSPENINIYQERPEYLVEYIEVKKIAHEYTYYFIEPYQNEWNHNKSLCRNVESKDTRLLNVLAYFSSIYNESCSILGFVPYVVSINNVRLVFNNISVKDEYIYAVLNGKIVALCCDKKKSSLQGNITSNFTILPCYGFGIIRGVDLVNRKLYLITPLDFNKISSINTLVYCEFLPDCHVMFASDAQAGTFIPYVAPDFNDDAKYFMKTPKRKFNTFRLLELKNQE